MTQMALQFSQPEVAPTWKTLMLVREDPKDPDYSYQYWDGEAWIDSSLWAERYTLEEAHALNATLEDSLIISRP